MKRVDLVEAFAKEVRQFGESSGNEALNIKVVSGSLDFLTHSEETDDDAIHAARFVRGELKLENGKLFTFWVAGADLGGVGDTTVYRTEKPPTG
jgi:hypothetical protein